MSRKKLPCNPIFRGAGKKKKKRTNVAVVTSDWIEAKKKDLLTGTQSSPCQPRNQRSMQNIQWGEAQCNGGDYLRNLLDAAMGMAFASTRSAPEESILRSRLKNNFFRPGVWKARLRAEGTSCSGAHQRWGYGVCTINRRGERWLDRKQQRPTGMVLAAKRGCGNGKIPPIISICKISRGLLFPPSHHGGGGSRAG